MVRQMKEKSSPRNVDEEFKSLGPLARFQLQFQKEEREDILFLELTLHRKDYYLLTLPGRVPTCDEKYSEEDVDVEQLISMLPSGIQHLSP